MEKVCRAEQELQLSPCQRWGARAGFAGEEGRQAWGGIRRLVFLFNVIMVRLGLVWQRSEPCPAARLQGHLNFYKHRNNQQLPDWLIEN